MSPLRPDDPRIQKTLEELEKAKEALYQAITNCPRYTDAERIRAVREKLIQLQIENGWCP